MIDKKYATHDREPFFELARPYIESNSKVLDIGAGYASFAKYFSRNDFYLFDGNPETVTFLKNNYEYVKEGKLPNLPYEDSYFDVIHCSHVIEHLEAETLYQTILEMNRCLKPGGLLVISAPLMWSGFYDDLSHLRPYPPIVFINYLCSNNQTNRTRIIIKDKYKVKKLVYRYNETNPKKEFYYYSSTVISYIIKFWYKIFNFFHLKTYEKSGFTIIIQKQEN